MILTPPDAFVGPDAIDAHECVNGRNLDHNVDAAFLRFEFICVCLGRPENVRPASKPGFYGSSLYSQKAGPPWGQPGGQPKQAIHSIKSNTSCALGSVAPNFVAINN